MDFFFPDDTIDTFPTLSFNVKLKYNCAFYNNKWQMKNKKKQYKQNGSVKVIF